MTRDEELLNEPKVWQIALVVLLLPWWIMLAGMQIGYQVVTGQWEGFQDCKK